MELDLSAQLNLHLNVLMLAWSIQGARPSGQSVAVCKKPPYIYEAGQSSSISSKPIRLSETDQSGSLGKKPFWLTEIGQSG